MKGLFDFTRVDAEVVTPVTSVILPVAVSVYLASEQGFDNYCRDCPSLVAVQEPRVFCALEKCLKPTCVAEGAE